MKPVTEDQVQALLSGLERREKEALRALAVKTSEVAERSGKMTAHVTCLSDDAGADPVFREVGHDDEVVDMAGHRAKRRRRISSKGLLFYATAGRAMSTH